MIVVYVLIGIFGYLLGSVPFGLVITRAAGLGDIRKIGSGNIGATNVLRTGRKDLALLTVICDISKAAVAAYIAMLLPLDDYHLAGLIAGTMAVIGHNFPVWLDFKGGKGVASTIGMILITSLPSGIAVICTWVAVAAATRYSSLAALIALGLSPFYGHLFTGSNDYFICYGILAVLCFVRHRENIVRLVKKQETKIKFGGKKKDTDEK